MNAQIARHLNVMESAIAEIQVWASVFWVRVKGLGARFVSKKVVKMEKVVKMDRPIIPSSDFSSFTIKKVEDRIYEEYAQELMLDGLSSAMAMGACKKAVQSAISKMGGKARNIGGYPAVEQLYDRTKEIIDSFIENSEIEIESPVSESDIEDALNTIDSIAFTGSEKQIKWARNIAQKHAEEIAASKLAFSKLPTAAKWWIENRNDIDRALKNI